MLNSIPEIVGKANHVPGIYPDSARVVLLGEAPGSEEDIFGEPFIGASGKELRRMCAEAGLDFATCAIDNVFSWRPENNVLPKFLVESPGPGIFARPISKSQTGRRLFVHPDLYEHVNEKFSAIRALSPNVVCALGSTALWLCDPGNPGISKSRGATFLSDTLGCKVVATYHPAAVLRDWSLRITSVLDLRKAAGEASSPKLCNRPLRVWLDPTLADLEEYRRLYLDPIAGTETRLAFDIETAGGRITCVGFSVQGSDLSIVVPTTRQFAPPKDSAREFYSLKDETTVWTWLKSVLENPNTRKLAQNGVYDVQWLAKFGVYVRNFSDDTMVLAHSFSPEMPKSLGYLGSVFTNHPSWKSLKPKGTEKYGDE